jgi:hypothetical protein
MLKMYMGYDAQDGGVGGACLIFAHNVKEARYLAVPFLSSWFDTRWIDVRAKLLTAEHLRAEGNKEKLQTDTPHVIESPAICPYCELWGNAPVKAKDGKQLCEGCVEEYEWQTEEV